MLLHQRKIIPKNTDTAYVIICDQYFRGFALIGCSEFKCWDELTTPNSVKTSIAFGSKDNIFARENEITVHNALTSDFNLHTDLVFPRFI